MARSVAAFAAVAAAVASAQTIPDEDWGYVDVRTGAHMFWWLYGANTTVASRASTPLVMWLQGGPGASGTGYGNFEEMGPLDVNLQPRNTTWLNAPANLLFVDNPVGTGFSYVDDLSLLTTNNTQIAADLVSLLGAFLQKYPQFASAPFYVFCESYGGKMTTGFAQALLAAIGKGSVKVNFKGIALGDSWISPIDFVDAWAPFLRSVALLDANEASIIGQTTAKCDAAVAAGKWAQATNIWNDVETVVEQYSDNTDFYNILLHGAAGDEATGPSNYGARSLRAGRRQGRTSSTRRARRNPKRVLSEAALALAPAGVRHDALHALWQRHGSVYLGDDLDTLMNGPIRSKLGIIPAGVTWGGQSGAVFTALSGDFMRPVWDGVDALLQSGFNVTVYEGQLDLICCQSGAEAWMDRLTWAGMPAFQSAAKVPQYATLALQILDETGGFRKRYANLDFWTVLDAGHMVPADNGPMALAMIRTILSGK